MTQRNATVAIDEPVLSEVARQPFRFRVSEDRREAVKRLTGIYQIPTLTPHPGQSSYSMEEVLEMFPALRRSDGTWDMEAADRIKSLLAQHLQNAIRSLEAARTAKDDERLKGELFELSRRREAAPMQQIEAILLSLSTLPTTIRPTDELISVSDRYQRFDTGQMRSLIYLVATAQTAMEEGNDLERARRMMKSFAPRLNPPMTDEQADILLNTPLEKLATAEYAK